MSWCDDVATESNVIVRLKHKIKKKTKLRKKAIFMWFSREEEEKSKFSNKQTQRSAKTSRANQEEFDWIDVYNSQKQNLNCVKQWLNLEFNLFQSNVNFFFVFVSINHII